MSIPQIGSISRITDAEKHAQAEQFFERSIDAESRASRALQEMFEAHQPSVWCLGHFHINRKFLSGKTRFRCLSELAGFEVVRIECSMIRALRNRAAQQNIPIIRFTNVAHGTSGIEGKLRKLRVGEMGKASHRS